FGPPHCRTRSFWRWNPGERDPGGRLTTPASRPSAARGAAAPRRDRCRRRGRAEPRWCGRARRGGRRSAPTACGRRSRECFLRDREVALVAREPLALLGRVELEVGEGVLVRAVLVLGTVGQVVAHRLRGVGRKLAPER